MYAVGPVLVSLISISGEINWTRHTQLAAINIYNSSTIEFLIAHNRSQHV